MKIIDAMYNTENALMEKLIGLVGYSAAVRIEDFIMIVFALLFGYVVGIFRLSYLYKPNYFFSKKLESFVFLKNEHRDVVDYSFRIPKNFLDRIEMIFGLLLADKDKSRLEISKARWYSRLTIMVFAKMLVFMAIIVICLYNVP